MLDFDHVKEKGVKFKNVSRIVAGTYSIAKMMSEIEKCEVRCANCHRRVTAKRAGWYKYLDVEAPAKTREQRIQTQTCGTRARYRSGCRCEPCRKAHSDAVIFYRRRRKRIDQSNLF